MTEPDGRRLEVRPMKRTGKALSAKDQANLLDTLQSRFDAHPGRHSGITWTKVQARLEAHPEKLWPLREMEESGGEPDVIAHDSKSGAFRFVDCSPQTPKGRTSVCYDRAGLESRRDHPPKTTAMDLAAKMGVELLTEDEYLALQELGEFDTKTSSWVQTPEELRSLGGALYGERRYGRVFVGHNGAQSHYAARGFRCSLWV